MPNTEKQRLTKAIFYPVVLCFTIIFVFVVEKILNLDFSIFGIEPRETKGLVGIVTMPFIHADVRHLVQNIVPFFLLTLTLFYFYRGIALVNFVLMWLFSGLLLWITGRPSAHIGASGMVYALAFFLFFSGIFRRHIPLIAVSAIIVFFYGSLVWGVFPWEAHPEISWEGHLSGAFAGTFFAIIFRKSGPQKPEPIWEDEEQKEDEDFERQTGFEPATFGLGSQCSAN